MSAPDGLARLGELEHVVGPQRVAYFVRNRLVALARPLVEQSGALVPADASWTTYMTDKITANVP
jgi:hypothetical protein